MKFSNVKHLSIIAGLVTMQSVMTCEPDSALLDYTFNGDGVVTVTNLGVLYSGIFDVASQSVITVGKAIDAEGALFMRTDTEGNILNRVALSPVGTTSCELRDIIAISPSLYAAAGSNINDGGGFLLALLDTAGNLLHSNTLAFDLGAARALALVSSNTIVAVGTTSSQFAIAFYNTSGVLTAMETVNSSSGVDPIILDVALLSDNTIVVAGQVITQANNLVPLLVRYNLDGTVINGGFVDPSLIQPGAASAGAQSIVALDGRFLISGVVGGNLPLKPYLAEVSNDLRIVTPLQVINELDIGLIGYNNGVEIQADNYDRILMLTSVQTGTDVGIADSVLTRMFNNGAYDTSFADNCIASQVVLHNVDSLTNFIGLNFVSQPDGTIIVIGGNGDFLSGMANPVLVRIVVNSAQPVTLSTDPLTAAIQRKYFGITA